MEETSSGFTTEARADSEAQYVYPALIPSYTLSTTVRQLRQMNDEFDLRLYILEKSRLFPEQWISLVGIQHSA